MANLKFETISAALAPTATQRAPGTVLVDEFGRLWFPNSAGGYTVPSDVQFPLSGELARTATDTLPVDIKKLTATGLVRTNEGRLVSIKCVAGVGVTVTLRDVCTQNVADTNTTAPLVYPTTAMAIGDEIELAAEFYDGLHLTLAGTTPEILIKTR